MKFFNLDDKEVKVSYKLKVPSELFSLDFSSDGNHYAMALNDGSLIIKSKLLEDTDENEKDEEEKLIENILKPSFVSTSKNYKYFYRG